MPKKTNKSKKEIKTSTSIDDTKTSDVETDLHDSEYEEISISSEQDIDWNDEEDLDIDYGNNTDTNEDNCMYDKVHKPHVKKNSLLSLENDSDNNSDEEDDNIENNENTINSNIYVKNTDRCSANILTKYEVVRLLGERTSQLSSGAKPMLNGVNGLQARTIAQLELESKMIPLKIIRPLPNGMKEIWSVDELILKDIYIQYGFKGGKVDKNSILNRAPNITTTSNNFY